MRIGQAVVAALASCCSLGFAQSRLSVPESQGIVITGNFDEDGCDDVLVLGHFGLMKQLGAPLVRLNVGPSLLFEPWFVSPYVRNKGEWIYTNGTDSTLDKATGDYDGDGIDEVVIPTLVYVGGPSTKRPYLPTRHPNCSMATRALSTATESWTWCCPTSAGPQDAWRCS